MVYRASDRLLEFSRKNGEEAYIVMWSESLVLIPVWD
jgi:hypothetical protein